MTGDYDDNSEQEYQAGQNFEFEANIWKISLNTKVDLQLAGSEVKTHFKHDISGDEAGMGFVLSDSDVGDRFDVKIGIDPKYGSFVFKTVGGLSKCWYEEGTDQREKPAIQLVSKPKGGILPYNPAVFQVQLQNLGMTWNEYDLSMDRRDNSHGLAVYANGASLAVNQHYEYMDPHEAVETTISIFRGPVLYEYDPIQLRFESRCDTNTYGTLELFTHIRASDNKKVIRFARECPKVSLEGWLGTGRVVLNSAMDRKAPLVVQNLERNGRGALAAMAADVDDTLKEVHLLYRKHGSQTWLRARGPKKGSPTERIDMNLISSTEDDFGFVVDEWNTDQLIDGEYEVMVRSICPEAPSVFREAKTAISILKLDTISPKPFAFPSESETYHVGEPMIFEFDEELDCIHPYNFVLKATVAGIDREYDMTNMVVVCEDRLLGIQFDSSKVDFNELTGKTASITLSSVRDTSGNVASDASATVNFSKSNPAFRRLNTVPSIKLFQKTSSTAVAPTSATALDSTMLEMVFNKFEELEGKLERFEKFERMLESMQGVLEANMEIKNITREEGGGASGSVTWRGIRKVPKFTDGSD